MKSFYFRYRFIFTVVFVLVNWLIENKNCPSGVWSRAPTAQSFSTISALRMASPDTIILWTTMQPLGRYPRDLPCLRICINHMTKCCAAIGWTLSTTSCSQSALNGFVLDMSGSGQAKRICLQHLDMSRCCRQIRIWSLRADLS